MLANIASEEGGGMFILSKDLLISQSSFINNESPNSGGIYARVTDLTIINSKFHGNMGNDDFGVSGGIFLDKILVAFIDSVDFFNNSASTGGAISLASCSNVRFSNCNFRDNIANNVDGGAIWSFGSNFDITNTFFRNNSGWRNGGAVSVSDAESARISNCSFDNNMVFTGSGSSIWISASIFAAIFDNNFYNNVALNGSGGAVYWMWATMPAPLNLTELNYFWNNDALYGCDVATEAIKLTLNESNVYNITDYTQPVPVVIAYLHDYYGQTVQTQSSSLLAASVLSAVQCYQSVGYLTGGYVEQFRAGVASFEDLLAYCDPGYAMPIDLTTTIAGRTLTVSFVLKFRECVTGEYVGDSVCSKCPDGTFSVTNPATVSSLSELSQQNVCLKCPDGADNCNSGTVNLKDGYWRISEYAASTMSCPYVRSCIGGSGVGDDLCADGYYGITFAR